MRRQTDIRPPSPGIPSCLFSYYKLIDNIHESSDYERINSLNTYTFNLITGLKTFIVKSKRKNVIPLDEDNAVTRLLAAVINGKIPFDKVAIIISNMEILARNNLLIGTMKVDLIEFLSENHQAIITNEMNARFVISALGNIATKTESNIEITQKQFNFINAALKKIVAGTKINNDDISNFLLGLSKLVPFAAFLKTITHEKFNRNIVKLINRIDLKNPSTMALSLTLLSCAKLCYHLGEPFYKKTKNKLTELIIFIQKNSKKYLKNLSIEDKTQLSQSFFYFLIVEKINHKNEFELIEKFHKKFYDEIKDTATEGHDSTDIQFQIQQQLENLYPNQLTVEAEAFTPCGFHVDLLLTNQSSGKQIIIEVDGKIHNEARDEYRNEMLKKAGYKVIHITNEQWLDSKNKKAFLQTLLASFLKDIKPLANRQVSRTTSTTATNSYTNMFDALQLDPQELSKVKFTAGQEEIEVEETKPTFAKQKPKAALPEIKTPTAKQQLPQEKDLHKLIAKVKEGNPANTPDRGIAQSIK